MLEDGTETPHFLVVDKNLTKICVDILKTIESDPNILENVITFDELCIFFRKTQKLCLNPQLEDQPVEENP